MFSSLYLAWGAAALCALAWLWLAAARWMKRLANARRGAIAVRAERDAEALLAAHGYTVRTRQPATSWPLLVDGEPMYIDVRADLLVSRAGRRFVAEVKSGPVATRLDTAATRRQLVEYALAYDVDAVLLVDMERGRIHEIGLPRARRRAPSLAAIAAAAAAIAATAVVVMALAWLDR